MGIIDLQIPTRKTLNSAAYSKFKLSAYSNLNASNIALTECGCGMIGPYKTPWCEMIKCSRDINILHLWYKLTWMQEEIEKRSSYLGKFRRTEESKHLLDLISMTTYGGRNQMYQERERCLAGASGYDLIG